MAAVSCVLSEDQFLCSICLEVFTDPVTTTCGHSFCTICINKHWDSSDLNNCPICKQDFGKRPELKLNTVLAEMVFEFKNNPEVEDTEVEMVSSEHQPSEAGEVVCDVCTEPRLKAVKSCLVCLASYCQSHLEPHMSTPRLRRHQLIEPQGNLEDRICPTHDRPLEMFCREHSLLICLQCTSSDHKDHETVPIKEESEEKQAELEETIKERREKIEELRRSVELSQKNADTETEDGVKLFNALMECVQQSLEKFKHGIAEKHKEAEQQAAEQIEEIEAELSQLEQRRAEMKELWKSGDHFHFLQTFTSVKPAPELRDWSQVKVCSAYKGKLLSAMSQLQDNEIPQNIQLSLEPYLKTLEEFAVDVVLDPDTAHPNIDVLYSKKAKYISTANDCKYSPDRFNSNCCVLGQQKFSSGRFYFEVEVKGSRNWAVGVARETARRRGNYDLIPYNGFWLLEWDNKSSCPCKVGGEELNLKGMPWRIGVFVDYEQGLICFYKPGNAELIKCLTGCSFNGNLLPLLSPGDRYGALQIA